MNLLRFKYWYFVFSGVVILPGLFFLIVYGVRLGMDFTGGSLLELQFEQPADTGGIEEIFRQRRVDVSSIQRVSKQEVLVRTKVIDQAKRNEVAADLSSRYGAVKQLRFETVGPTIGKELQKNALLAFLFASLAIMLYIAWAFRSVPKPASSIRFAVCAIVALCHDVLVLVGVMAILGYYFHAEVDALFVTALLTVIGFSVHDTIVVFDRIRENIRRHITLPFAQVVNDSIVQTFGRSLMTSLTVLLVLLALLLFGGASIRWFIAALLIGITSGTYSSIFNAAPLLVVWHERATRTA